MNRLERKIANVKIMAMIVKGYGNNEMDSEPKTKRKESREKRGNRQK